jgi:LEA14-like dessication related protein
LLTAVLGSCTKPEPPTIKPRSVEVTGVTPKGITLKAVLDVHNPNGFALSAQSVTAKVLFPKKITLGPVKIPHKLKLPAKKTTQLAVKVPASWSSAAQLTSLAATSETIPYTVEGQVTIGGKKLNADVDFEIKGEVTRAELVKAGLKGVPILENLPIPSNLPFPDLGK